MWGHHSAGQLCIFCRYCEPARADALLKCRYNVLKQSSCSPANLLNTKASPTWSTTVICLSRGRTLPESAAVSTQPAGNGCNFQQSEFMLSQHVGLLVITAIGDLLTRRSANGLWRCISVQQHWSRFHWKSITVLYFRLNSNAGYGRNKIRLAMSALRFAGVTFAFQSVSSGYVGHAVWRWGRPSQPGRI